MSDGIEEITSKGWDFLLARCVLIIVCFLPFFTMKEIERVFGKERIRGMFFCGQAQRVNAGTEMRDDPAKHSPA